MASDIKKLREDIRAEWVDFLTEMVQRKGDETLLTASNEFAVPVVDHDGNEHYVVITVKIPTGSRDGEPYDGYAAAQDYAMKCEERKAKAAEKERKAAERKAKSAK